MVIDPASPFMNSIYKRSYKLIKNKEVFSKVDYRLGELSPFAKGKNRNGAKHGQTHQSVRPLKAPNLIVNINSCANEERYGQLSYYENEKDLKIHVFIQGPLLI